MTRLRLVCIALLVLAPPATAEGKLFLVSSPALPEKGPPAETSILDRADLRPNVDLPVYVVVHNPKEEEKAFTVSLFSNGHELAKGQVTVPSKTSRRVAMAPAIVRPPADPVKPAGSAAVALAGPKPVLQLRLHDEDGTTVHTISVVVTLLPAANYVQPKSGPDAADVSENRLKINFNAVKGTFRGPPARVRLDLRPAGATPTFLPVEVGALEGDLSLDEPLTLFAELRRPTGNKKADTDREPTVGIIGVSVDGVERAFEYQVSTTGDSSDQLTTPQEIKKASIRLGLPKTLRPGAACPIQLGVAAPPLTAKLELAVDRLQTNNVNQYVTVSRFSTAREEKFFLTIGGPEDSLVFGSVVKDHTVNLNTAGLIGKIGVRARLLDEEKNELASDEGVLILDPTPPQVLSLKIRDIEPASDKENWVSLASANRLRWTRGRPLEFQAHAVDKESEIQKVMFFVGDPPEADGKPAPGGLVVTATLNPQTGIATGKLPYPTDRAALLNVGVRAINGADLVADKTVQIELVDPLPTTETISSKAKKTTGDLKGTVVQGSIRQPGLTVELRDEKGEIKKTASTDSLGRFEIKGLPPGMYRATVNKVAAKARAEEQVSIEAGDKPATVELRLLRKGVP